MGVEQHFLIVHCKKFDTYLPIPLTRPPEVDPKRINKIEPDFPCLKHNSDRDRMGERFHFVPHGSESVLVSVKSPDGYLKDATSEAIDKAVIIFEAAASKKRPKPVEKKAKKSEPKKRKR